MTADPLRQAEDELAHLRARIAQVAAWINNPAHDPAARTNLAHTLGLPTPRQEN